MFPLHDLKNWISNMIHTDLPQYNWWWWRQFLHIQGSVVGRSCQGRHALGWLISPILDRQILGHQGHRKVGPVGSFSCASFCHLLLSSAASHLVISKSCAALLVFNHHAAWFSASCSQCLGLMPAWVNWPFS